MAPQVNLSDFDVDPAAVRELVKSATDQDSYTSGKSPTAPSGSGTSLEGTGESGTPGGVTTPDARLQVNRFAPAQDPLADFDSDPDWSVFDEQAVRGQAQGVDDAG